MQNQFFFNTAIAFANCVYLCAIFSIPQREMRRFEEGNRHRLAAFYAEIICHDRSAGKTTMNEKFNANGTVFCQRVVICKKSRRFRANHVIVAHCVAFVSPLLCRHANKLQNSAKLFTLLPLPVFYTILESKYRKVSKSQTLGNWRDANSGMRPLFAFAWDKRHLSRCLFTLLFK